MLVRVNHAAKRFIQGEYLRFFVECLQGESPNLDWCEDCERAEKILGRLRGGDCSLVPHAWLSYGLTAPKSDQAVMVAYVARQVGGKRYARLKVNRILWRSRHTKHDCLNRLRERGILWSPPGRARGSAHWPQWHNGKYLELPATYKAND